MLLGANLSAVPLVQSLLATQLTIGFNSHSNSHRNIMPGRLQTFHEGEAFMRDAMRIPPGYNPTAIGLPGPYAARVEQSALMAVGTFDDAGRPWTTVWGGARGLAAPIAGDVLGISTLVDARHDPVYAALWGDARARGGVVRPGSGGDGGQQGKLVGALAIDLDSRDRMKLAGLVVAGSAERPSSSAETETETEVNVDGEPAADDDAYTYTDGGAADLQAAVLITESLGNCPKYLNKKAVTRRTPRGARLASEGLPLSDEALALVARADMFFLSTTTGDTMDTNHRGGVPGFVRVVRNDAGGVTLAYPEYSGNRLYQSLGNLKVDPRIGITFPDFDTADVLYATGTATVLLGDAASALLPRSNLAVSIAVTDARLVLGGLPFRGAPGEPSPYNPPLRPLRSERAPPVAQPSRPDLTATLVAREVLTPSVARFTFELSGPGGSGGGGEWRPGQHVTLDFAPELYAGYSHMRDDDPQSINDDFTRTFTVSSEPPPPPAAAEGEGEAQGRSRRRRLEITVRRHGPATGLLWRQNLRAPLELRVLGFGGEEAFRLPTTTTSEGEQGPEVVYVAGGVGVTPLLAQARGVLASRTKLRVLWTLRREDLPLAARAFADAPGLAAVTTLFVTGDDSATAAKDAEGEGEGAMFEKLRGEGVAALERRRMSEADLADLRGGGRLFFLCAGPGLRRKLECWLDGEKAAWEDFGY